MRRWIPGAPQSARRIGSGVEVLREQFLALEVGLHASFQSGELLGCEALVGLAPPDVFRGISGSSTTNLSWAERPVCTPVFTIKAPSADSVPSCRRIASATRAGAVRFAWTGRDACTPVPARASAA